MPSETTEATSVRYVPIVKENWQAFFDALTRVLEGRTVDIEVIGPEFGDQIQAEWLPLNGLTYDRKADTFYVYTESIDRDLDHAIPNPRDIVVRMGASGLEEVIVVDADRHEHIVRMRQALMLPEQVG